MIDEEFVSEFRARLNHLNDEKISVHGEGGRSSRSIVTMVTMMSTVAEKGSISANHRIDNGQSARS